MKSLAINGMMAYYSRTYIEENLNQNTNIFNPANTIDSVVCKLSAIPFFDISSII